MSNGYTFPAKPIRGKKTRRRKFQERRARRPIASLECELLNYLESYPIEAGTDPVLSEETLSAAMDHHDKASAHYRKLMGPK